MGKQEWWDTGNRYGLDQLSVLANRFIAESKNIPCEIRCHDDSVKEIERRIPTIRIPSEAKYEFMLMGLPIYSDPTVPPGQIRVLNSQGEIIQEIQFVVELTHARENKFEKVLDRNVT